MQMLWPRFSPAYKKEKTGQDKALLKATKTILLVHFPLEKINLPHFLGLSKEQVDWEWKSQIFHGKVQGDQKA